MTKKQAQKIIKKAYELFKPIPPKQWITRLRTDTEGACCALGHWDRLTSGKPNNYSWKNCNNETDDDPPLRTAVKLFMPFEIAYVNNGIVRAFPQKSPKARVMACLKKILKENGEPA